MKIKGENFVSTLLKEENERPLLSLHEKIELLGKENPDIYKKLFLGLKNEYLKIHVLEKILQFWPEKKTIIHEFFLKEFSLFKSAQQHNPKLLSILINNTPAPMEELKEIFESCKNDPLLLPNFIEIFDEFCFSYYNHYQNHENFESILKDILHLLKKECSNRSKTNILHLLGRLVQKDSSYSKTFENQLSLLEFSSNNIKRSSYAYLVSKLNLISKNDSLLKIKEDIPDSLEISLILFFLSPKQEEEYVNFFKKLQEDNLLGIAGMRLKYLFSDQKQKDIAEKLLFLSEKDPFFTEIISNLFPKKSNAKFLFEAYNKQQLKAA